MNINPNCSEAIMRIDLTGLSDKEINIIRDRLADAENEEWWGDTSFGINDIFGKKIITIDGNAPYNSQSELDEYLEVLPFWGKVRTQYDER